MTSSDKESIRAVVRPLLMANKESVFLTHPRFQSKAMELAGEMLSGFQEDTMLDWIDDAVAQVVDDFDPDRAGEDLRLSSLTDLMMNAAINLVPFVNLIQQTVRGEEHRAREEKEDERVIAESQEKES